MFRIEPVITRSPVPGSKYPWAFATCRPAALTISRVCRWLIPAVCSILPAKLPISYTATSATAREAARPAFWRPVRGCEKVSSFVKTMKRRLITTRTLSTKATDAVQRRW